MLYPPITQHFTNSLESTPRRLLAQLLCPWDGPRARRPDHRRPWDSRPPRPEGDSKVMMCHDVMIPRFYHEYVEMIPRFCQQLQYLWPINGFLQIETGKAYLWWANHGFRWTFSLQQIEWNNQKSGEHVTFNKSMTPTIRKQTDRAGVENCSGSVPKKGVTTSLFNGGSSCHGYFRGYERFHIKLLYNHQVLGHTGWMWNHVDMGNVPGMWWHVHDNCDIEQYMFARVCPQSMSITETSGLGTFRHINKIK